MTDLTEAPTAMDLALQALREAKQAETDANTKRIEAEHRVISLMGPLKDEGTTKMKTSYFRASVVTKLNRSISDEAALLSAVPEAIGKRLVRFKSSLNVTVLREIRANEPEIYAAISPFITAKPAKPSVALEVL